jgi:glycerol-3-phosphate dehydrogenase
LFGPQHEARPQGLPIAEQVHAVLFEGAAPSRAVQALMERTPVGEMAGLGFEGERS